MYFNIKASNCTKLTAKDGAFSLTECVNARLYMWICSQIGYSRSSQVKRVSFSDICGAELSLVMSFDNFSSSILLVLISWGFFPLSENSKAAHI